MKVSLLIMSIYSVMLLSCNSNEVTSITHVSLKHTLNIHCKPYVYTMSTHKIHIKDIPAYLSRPPSLSSFSRMASRMYALKSNDVLLESFKSLCAAK